MELIILGATLWHAWSGTREDHLPAELAAS